MEITKLELKNAAGDSISITMQEARDLYFELKNIFEPTITYPTIFEQPKYYNPTITDTKYGPIIT